MYPLLPYHRLVIETSLDNSQVTARLGPSIAVRKWSLVERRIEPFEGHLRGDQFKINRIIRYRNSFLPVIVGSILPTAGGTRIQIEMRLHVFVAIFQIIWIAAAVSMGVAAALATGRHMESVLGISGALIFCYLLFFFCFGPEARKAEVILREILAS